MVKFHQNSVCFPVCCAGIKKSCARVYCAHQKNTKHLTLQSGWNFRRYHTQIPLQLWIKSFSNDCPFYLPCITVDNIFKFPSNNYIVFDNCIKLSTVLWQTGVCFILIRLRNLFKNNNHLFLHNLTHSFLLTFIQTLMVKVF